MSEDVASLTQRVSVRKFKLYSKRNAAPGGNLIHDIPEQFKMRLIQHLGDLCSGSMGGALGLIANLESLFLKEYGYLNASSFVAARRSDFPVYEHFYCSGLEQSLDFIEAIFTSPHYNRQQEGVDIVNDLFNEMGIGYRLSDFITRVTKMAGSRSTIEYEYPTITPIREERNFDAVVKPALSVLARSEFKVANSELLDAFTAARTQHYDEAITNACSAYESFIKSVCTTLTLPFDPQRDTCSKLVAVLIDNHVIPDFYRNQMEAVGTIRNKIGSAHGRGPQPLVVPDLAHSDHMINIVCANILLINELAKVYE